jgi:thiamine kinase-like enzyme
MSPGADPGLNRVLEALGSRLGEVQGEPQPLEGGITNRNYRLRAGGADYVLRMPGKDTELLGIDRQAECRATEIAARAGVAPEVAAWLPEVGCLVTRFVPGAPVGTERLREPAVLAEVAARLRAIHTGPPLPTAFSAFRVVEAYRDSALARGASVPAAYDDALALARRIEPALSGPGHEPVPCHNDLLCANFIAQGERIWIVDWEYAGMGDRWFDLANLSINNEFGDEDDAHLLQAYFQAPADARGFACLRLLRAMSDFREAMWGVVQSTVSELDFDFAAYADEHFERLAQTAADPRLERWLQEAHGDPA